MFFSDSSSSKFCLEEDSPLGSAVRLISLLVVLVISSGVADVTSLDSPAGTDPTHRPGHMVSEGGSHDTLKVKLLFQAIDGSINPSIK